MLPIYGALRKTRALDEGPLTLRKGCENAISYSRPVVPGCARCAMAHPDFGRSVNPISTRGDRLYPPNYYWHIRNFRPSDGSVSKSEKLLLIIQNGSISNYRCHAIKYSWPKKLFLKSFLDTILQPRSVCNVKNKFFDLSVYKHIVYYLAYL